MKNPIFLLAGLVLASVAFAEDQHSEGWTPPVQRPDPMTFTADVLAADAVTKAAVASGHVHAVSAPLTLTSEYMTRDENGVMLFQYPTMATTCTNGCGHTHWNVTGEVEYRTSDSVVLRNAWIRLFEVPVIWIPYLWYPLDTDCGFKWMPGYTGRWGGFVLSRYRYHLLGDNDHTPNTFWLKGNTNLDYRYKQGVALGEDLFWNLGDFGKGDFKVYYAWDQNAEKEYGESDNGSGNWGSLVERERYGLVFNHRWQVTERDRIFLRASHLSDSFFQEDFMQYNEGFFSIRQGFWASANSGAFFEHLEDRVMTGLEVSGRLNEFYGMTQRLPEFYFDVNPGPLFALPINYESQNRLGVLDRKYAKYANASASVFGTNPGLWCDYTTVRFDTYHRLSQSFRSFDDVVAITPRVGFHGTYWNDAGETDVYGQSEPQTSGHLFRSIAEAGVTFAARANGWVDDSVSHMIEPYADILAQKAWHSGGGDARALVFDNIDASMTWEDQFAGRGRNLPYSYFGVTPGVRNAWSELTESGNLRQFLEVDAYAAMMFGKSSFEGVEGYGDYESHKLAKFGDPNYGKNAMTLVPGVRAKWDPDRDISLRTRAEYDSENNNLALGEVSFSQKISKDFDYMGGYNYRNHRYWDYSSIPFDALSQRNDELNMVKSHLLFASFTYRPLDWFMMSPIVRWDLRDQELDSAGSWFDVMTDCLGFRFIVEYMNEYTRLDGYHRDSDWSFGFYIYLRAYGAQSGDIFSGQ